MASAGDGNDRAEIPRPRGAMRQSAHGTGLGWPIVRGMASAGILAVAACTPFAPASSAPRRDVVLDVEGVPPDYPVSLYVDGAAPLLREASGWLFERVEAGAREVTWVAGEGCTVDACAGGCPPWCGRGTLSLEVPEAPHVLQARLPLDLPEPSVVVAVPGVQDARVGLFRRVPDFPLLATLDGKPGGIVDGYKAAWRSVIPGEKELVFSVGACAPEALGCWPDRVCPDGCTSTIRPIVVPFGDQDVVVSLDLPAPK